MSSEQTKDALMSAAIRLTSREGVRTITARAVAAEADVNQALVFYHFQGVDGLLRHAFERATREMVADYAAELETVDSFTELHAVGMRLAERSRTEGSAALLAHAISAAHADPSHAELLNTSLTLWHDAVSVAVERVLDRHGVADAVDIDAIAASITSSTIGMITLDALPTPPYGATLPGLAGVATLVDRAAKLVPRSVLRRMLQDR